MDLPRPKVFELIDRAGGWAQFLARLTAHERALLPYQWDLWARPSIQIGPREWRGQTIPLGVRYSTVVFLAGRFSGKTRFGMEWARAALKNPRARVGLASATMRDAGETFLFGPSGLRAICPPWEQWRYDHRRSAVLCSSGAIAPVWTAESPGGPRGGEHTHILCDELCKWPRGDADEFYNNLKFSLRSKLCGDPKMVITTTPQRLPLLRRIIARPSTILLRGTLDDNRRNLTEETLRELHDSYDGTDIGRQELEGILLDDVEGSLWRRPWIEEPRIRPQSTDTGGVLQALERVGVTLSQVVLAIDPSTTAGDRSDACGLVVAAEGNAPRGGAVDERRHYYVLEDLTARVSPAKWAHSAVQAYHRWGCGRVVAETTKGGEAIEALLHHHDDGIRVIRRGGSDGKILRAEPVAALYEQRRVHHVGSFADLETELTDYTQGARSPNRMDALVWAVRDLHEGRAAFSW